MLEKLKSQNKNFKFILGELCCSDKAVCHRCGSGPFYPLANNQARRICDRCEVNFCLCKKCRALGWKLPPLIVNNELLSFATGEKKSWFCDDCKEEIGFYDVMS
jgi:hypothetical protein